MKALDQNRDQEQKKDVLDDWKKFVTKGKGAHLCYIYYRQ